MKILFILLTALTLLPACNSKNDAKAKAEPRRDAANAVDPKELLKNISEGGYIVYFRHSHRDKHAIPQISREQDMAKLCVPGTELSTLGIEEAKRISFTVKIANLPPGDAYSSPTCRTVKTAELVLNTTQVIEAKELMYDRILTKEEIEAKKAWSKDFFTQKIPEGRNIYVFGHEGGFDIKGIVLDEGEALVFKPDGTQENFIGKIDRKTWMK